MDSIDIYGSGLSSEREVPFKERLRKGVERNPRGGSLIIIMPIDLNDNFNKSAYELDSSLLAMIEVEVVE